MPVGKLKPLPAGTFGYVQDRAQGGNVFSCPLETTAGLGSFNVNALNISFAMSLKVFAGFTLNKRMKYIEEGIKALEKANTLIANANVLILNQITFQEKVTTYLVKQAAAQGVAIEQQLKAYEAEKEEPAKIAYASAYNSMRGDAEGINQQIEASSSTISGLRATIENNNQLVQMNLRELQVAHNELEELGLRESQELLRSFTNPIIITAKLLKGTEKEVVWVGTLTPNLIPLGQMKTAIVSPIASKPPILRMTWYPAAELVYESHVPLPSFTLGQAEPLELVITLIAPEQWFLSEEGNKNESGTGLLTAGNEALIESSKEILEMNPGAGLVNIVSSENSISYSNEP